MNICPCCKTWHDSTACPTPSVEGLGEMNCSGSCYLPIGIDDFNLIFAGETVTKDIQSADHRSILRVQISRQNA